MSARAALLAMLSVTVSLVPTSARASSVTTEATVGRGWLSGSVLGDVSLLDERLYLNLGYTGARTSLRSPISHQLAAGGDYAASRRWLISAMLSGSPNSRHVVPLTDELSYASTNRSFGSTFAVAYESAGLSELEWGLDGSLSVTGWEFLREFRGPAGVRRSRDPEGLLAVRAGFGGLVILAYDTELFARGSYTAYSQDPLLAGRFTEEELELLARRIARDGSADTVDEANARYLLQTVGGRLLQADAVNGLPTAPVRAELRLGVARFFGERWKGQLQYTFVRYVEGEGSGHVLSTRWRFRATDSVRLWGALSGQVDLKPGTVPFLSPLGTLGFEWTI